MSTGRPARTIRTDYLARVEGEGAMYVRIEDGDVRDVRLRIYEPPRFFEALLRGRDFTEAPDITARICGICPIAYQISAVQAMEDACGIAIDDGPIRDLRRLIYCGEWIESHSLHVHLLHAPDFLGYPGFIEMAQDHPRLAERGLQLKQAGNAVMELIGGRAVHPVNVRVGGFYRAPSRTEMSTLVEPLQRAREIALQTVEWSAQLEIPELYHAGELVALRTCDGYAIDRGRVASAHGRDFAVGELDARIVEEHVERSTALHARLDGTDCYLTGPLARYSLSSERLRALPHQAARQAGLGATCRNPFQSIVVRALEILQACDEALAIIADYEPPDPPAIDVQPRAGVGHGASEAPRGLLYHRYEIDEQGTILNARIVPPTSQNQLAIEQDLRAVVQRNAHLPDDQLRQRCEQAIRNHDPCISCATHFLDLTVQRT